MGYLYCIYSKPLEEFKIIKLKIKTETNHLFTLEYDEITHLGMIKKENMDKIYRLKNNHGKVIVTRNINKVSNNVKQLYQQELMQIDKLNEQIRRFSKKMQDVNRQCSLRSINDGSI